MPGSAGDPDFTFSVTAATTAAAATPLQMTRLTRYAFCVSVVSLTSPGDNAIRTPDYKLVSRDRRRVQR
jgi:hypothetical protein